MGEAQLSERFRVFGELAYYVAMDDLDIMIEEIEGEVDGYELELGASYRIATHVHLLGGYRMSSIEYDINSGGGDEPVNIEQKPAGFFVGAGFKF